MELDVETREMLGYGNQWERTEEILMERRGMLMSEKAEMRKQAAELKKLTMNVRKLLHIGATIAEISPADIARAAIKVGVKGGAVVTAAVKAGVEEAKRGPQGN